MIAARTHSVGSSCVHAPLQGFRCLYSDFDRLDVASYVHSISTEFGEESLNFHVTSQQCCTLTPGESPLPIELKTKEISAFSSHTLA